MTCHDLCRRYRIVITDYKTTSIKLAWEKDITVCLPCCPVQKAVHRGKLVVNCGEILATGAATSTSQFLSSDFSFFGMFLAFLLYQMVTVETDRKDSRERNGGDMQRRARIKHCIFFPASEFYMKVKLANISSIKCVGNFLNMTCSCVLGKATFHMTRV